jgi:light-regulated signal transduction histidine kinase (bacteriophytochrome)
MVAAHPTQRYGGLLTRYLELLSGYLQQPTEEARYNAYQLGRTAVQGSIGVEEMIGMHVEAIRQLASRHVSNFLQSNDLLIELMMPFEMSRQQLLSGLQYALTELAFQAAELSRSNDDLEDFTYVVSHDLKEPLRGIAAFSTFLAEDYADKLDEQGHKYASALRSSAMRMNALIEDLLKLSRIGRTRGEFATVSVESLLQDVRRDMAFALEQKKVDLRIQPNLPTITCQPPHLKQVFENLISNAIKFNDKPQPVIEIACHEDHSLYTFSVRDNGIGIDEKYYEKIFQIFQRLGRREDYEGTGAGLTICKKIVQAHGGKIWLESKVGQGSTFLFTIPKEVPRSQLAKEA